MHAHPCICGRNACVPARCLNRKSSTLTNLNNSPEGGGAFYKVSHGTQLLDDRRDGPNYAANAVH